MTAMDVLRRARAAGLAIVLNAQGQPVVTATTKRALTPALRADLRQHRAAIAWVLWMDASVAPCPHCGGTAYAPTGAVTEDGTEVWGCVPCGQKPAPDSAGAPGSPGNR